MYYFLALLLGILLSSTVLLNGELTAFYGVYSSAVITHVTGLILIIAIVLIKRDKPFVNRQPWFMYIGGAIGFFTLIATNFSFGRISVSAILALGLLGQSVTSLLVDCYGLLGMTKYPFHKRRVIGLLIVFSGIAVMTENFEILAVALSFGAGITTVISRSLNAKLSDATSVRVGTFYNYVSGLTAAIIAFLIAGGGEAIHSGFTLSPNFYIYLGGTVGVILISISNMIVTKISAFYLSLFLFIGQVFSGLVIDGIILSSFSVRTLTGGVLVAAGMIVDLFISKSRSKHKA